MKIIKTGLVCIIILLLMSSQQTSVTCKEYTKATIETIKSDEKYVLYTGVTNLKLNQDWKEYDNSKYFDKCVYRDKTFSDKGYDTAMKSLFSTINNYIPEVFDKYVGDGGIVLVLHDDYDKTKKSLFGATANKVEGGAFQN